MQDTDSEHVRELLREVGYPGFSRDIVAAGFVGQVLAIGPMVEIEFKPDTRDQAKIANMEEGIRAALRRANYADVQIKRVQPYVPEVPLRSAEDLEREYGGTRAKTNLGVDITHQGHSAAHHLANDVDPTSRLMTPLQAEMLEDGSVPENDLLALALGRFDVAPAAGYGPGGPQPLTGPREAMDFDPGVPVLQWDIDPQDPSASTHQQEMRLGDWDYRVWWQLHPRGDLLYVSMQAMREDWVDHDNNAVPHPIGRSEAVNLVYDESRAAVVAIYGTVRDFRPFVKAFGLAYSDAAAAQ